MQRNLLVVACGLVMTSCLQDNSEQVSSSSATGLSSSTLSSAAALSSQALLSSQAFSSSSSSLLSSAVLSSSGGIYSSSSLGSSSSNQALAKWDSALVTNPADPAVLISASNLFLQKVSQAMDQNRDFTNDFSTMTKPYSGAKDPLLDSLWNAYPGTRALCVQMQTYVEWTYGGLSEYGVDSLKITGPNSSYIMSEQVRAFNYFGGLKMGSESTVDCRNGDYNFFEFKSNGPYPLDSLVIQRKDGKKMVMRALSGLV